MKKYVGTKMLEAKPMNRGDYNKYRGWPIPLNENPVDEGYLVRYQDGYESWSPKEVFEESYSEYDETKLPFTALGMQSKDYKERFKAEYFQVVIRYRGLAAMMDKWNRNELSFSATCPRSTYNMQITAMTDYIAILEARAVMEGIELG